MNLKKRSFVPSPAMFPCHVCPLVPPQVKPLLAVPLWSRADVFPEIGSDYEESKSNLDSMTDLNDGLDLDGISSRGEGRVIPG